MANFSCPGFTLINTKEEVAHRGSRRAGYPCKFISWEYRRGEGQTLIKFTCLLGFDFSRSRNFYQLMTNWVFLSPHLDDVVLSCGALIHCLSVQGDTIQVWTICAADPPAGDLTPFAQSLHERWQTGPSSTAERRAEDLRACRQIGASAVHLGLADCIYRRGPDGSAVITGEEDLFQPLKPAEAPLIGQLATELQAKLPPEANLVIPLTLGGHVDHRLTRAAAERLQCVSYFYPDYPYAADPRVNELAALPAQAQRIHYSFGIEDELSWAAGVSQYRSQISTFWPNLEAMRAALRAYHQNGGGDHLWKKNG